MILTGDIIEKIFIVHESEDDWTLGVQNSRVPNERRQTAGRPRYFQSLVNRDQSIMGKIDDFYYL